jgi:catalase
VARKMEEFTANLDDDFRNVVQQLTELFVGAATNIRGRATHTTGIAARGTALIVTPADFPLNDFLSFGMTYPIVVRHATPRPAMGDNTDDRTLDGAAISIKFLHPDDQTGLGFHDLMMNTGRVMFVPSARAFNMMVHTPFGKRRPLIAAGLLNDDNLTEGYRTGSFTEFYYHSQIAFEFTDRNGAMQYIRFRAIPSDRGPERGLFPPSIRANGDTFAAAWPDDRRAEDYRRREFEVQVNHLTVNYLLQAQLHPADDPEALNSMKYWEERFFPWLDVARLHLDKTLTYAEMDALEFDANRTHDCINLPLAKNADDHASLGHARALVYWRARKARADSPQPHKV